MSDVGLRMMGKDPEGDARGVEVTDQGAVKTQVNGSIIDNDYSDEYGGDVIEPGGTLRIDHDAKGSSIGLTLRLSDGEGVAIKTQSQSKSGVSHQDDYEIKRGSDRVSTRWNVESKYNRILIKNVSDNNITIGSLFIFDYMSSYSDQKRSLIPSDLDFSDEKVPVGEELRIDYHAIGSSIGLALRASKGDFEVTNTPQSKFGSAFGSAETLVEEGSDRASVRFNVKTKGNRIVVKNTSNETLEFVTFEIFDFLDSFNPSYNGDGTVAGDVLLQAKDESTGEKGVLASSRDENGNNVLNIVDKAPYAFNEEYNATKTIPAVKNKRVGGKLGVTLAPGENEDFTLDSDIVELLDEVWSAIRTDGTIKVEYRYMMSDSEVGSSLSTYQTLFDEGGSRIITDTIAIKTDQLQIRFVNDGEEEATSDFHIMAKFGG